MVFPERGKVSNQTINVSMVKAPKRRSIGTFGGRGTSELMVMRLCE